MQDIYFYKYNKELNRVDKTNYLESRYFMRGDFESAINYDRPVIIIEHNNPYNFNYNYCWIKDLNRYYFIENITYLNYGVIKIELKQDLLMSFKDKLLLNEGFIERNEFEYNSLIEDREINFKYNKIIKENYIINSNDNVVNVSFDNENKDNEYIVITIVTNNFTEALQPVITVSPTNLLPDIFNVYTNQNVGINYALTFNQFQTFTKYVYENEGALSSVRSVIALPYKVAFDVYSTRPYQIYLNNALVSDEVCLLLKNPTSTYLILNDFYINDNLNIDFNKFFYYQPYTKFELYLPFYNWVEISLEQIIGKRLLLYYIVDYQTGTADVYLKNVTDNIILFQSNCQLGVKIGLSTSNQEILNTQRNANNLNLMLGLIGSGTSIIGGLASGNPLALGYGGVSIANQIASYTNSNAMLFPKNVYQNSSGMTQLFSDKKMKYRLTYPEVANDYNDIKHYKGLMLNEKRTLNQLKGFTKISSINLTNLYILNTPEFGDIDNYRCYITKNEIEELTTILNNGAIFENK